MASQFLPLTSGWLMPASFSKCLAVALFLFSFGVISSPWQDVESPLRTWKDNTGNFSVQARLVRVEGDQVELEKPDGSKLKVPIVRLSTADQEFISGSKPIVAPQRSAPPADSDASAEKPTITTLGSIRGNEQKLLYAKKIVEAYQAFLAKPGISETDKLAAKRRLSELEKEAARDSLMVGNKFYMLDEIRTFQEEANRELNAFLPIAGRKDKLEITKFLKANSRKDPTSCRANFLLGIGYAVASREYDLAVEEFQECVDRLSNFGLFASADPQTSLQAVYNNLALLQIRRGFLDSALKYWQLAYETKDTMPDPIRDNFMHQALFIRASVISKGHDYFSDPETTTLNRYTKFAEKIGITDAMIGTDSQQGWQYLSLQLTDVEPDTSALGVSLVDAACLNCNGTGMKACARCRGDGFIMGKVYDAKPLLNGDKVIIETSVKKKCEACEKGKVPCLDVKGDRLCNDGVEQRPNY